MWLREFPDPSLFVLCFYKNVVSSLRLIPTSALFPSSARDLVAIVVSIGLTGGIVIVGSMGESTTGSVRNRMGDMLKGRVLVE